MNGIDTHTTLRKAMNIIFTMASEDKTNNIAPSPQMPAAKGIEKYGEAAIATMIKEFKQLVDRAFPGKPVVAAINNSELTENDKKRALDAVNLIKVKRSGTVKGRTCANGSKEQYYLPEGDSVASPTASIEAIVSTLLIDIFEGRDVAIYNIPGAYLHAEMPEEHRVILKIKGKFVDIMCRVNPEFQKHVLIERGRKVLYLQVLRALYGCIRSALLWYNLFSQTLEKEGYVINPYDRCVANKTIDKKQCTMVWYVDDVKISHVDLNKVTEQINMIEDKFGKLTITRGDKLGFLGMDIKLNRKNKTVELSMKNHIEEAIEMFGEELKGGITSPGYQDLFTTFDGLSPELNDKKSKVFHSVTAKLLFITKRARPDIETCVSYLTTRVAKSNDRDWCKLKRVLNFLQHAIDDPRIIGASSLLDLYTWIDASYAVHPNMQGHTSGVMSYGTGVVHAQSGKQKLNVKSSTECKLVGTNEYCPFNIWQMMFMEEQGYPLRKNILYQDNQSAMRMQINGRNSCTGNFRHVHIRYFLSKIELTKGK